MQSGNPNSSSSRTSGEDAFDALLRRALAGDDAAIIDVIESLRPYLLLIANQNCDHDLRGKVGASDLVQSALIAAHRNFADFRGTTAEEFNRWVKQILNNNLIDARRHYKGTARRNIDDEIRLDDSPIVSDELEDAREMPTSLLLQSERRRLIERAMAELPENYARVVRLRNWQGLTFREIGQQLNTGEDAARKLWSRALLRLHDLIQAKFPELDSIWLDSNH